MMKMIKENFLKTELGSELENCIMVWDNAIKESWENTCTYCRVQWEVYKMVLLQFLGTEYQFTRTDEYFGLVTEDGTDWLIKVER